MSFRARLTFAYTGFFALALILLGCGVYFAVSRALYAGVERDLWAATSQIRRIYNAGGVDAVRLPTGELQLYLNGEFIQIFNNGNLGAQVFGEFGNQIGHTPNMAGRAVPLPTGATTLGPESNDTGMTVVRDINGQRLQSLITPLVLKRDNRVIGFLQVSRPLRDVEETLSTLTVILSGGGVIALLLTAAGAAVMARRALAPIERITGTAQSIVRAEDLGRRIPVPPHQDELQRLTVTINDLLARVEGLFTGQRRFVADVSHELRTPLAAMQGNLEVLTRGGCNNPELLDEALGDMRRETSRLIRMVNDLLLLAQSDAKLKLRHEPVELDTLMLEVFRELRPLATNVTLRIGAEDQVQVVGDRDRIKQALLNLGVNALQYTPPGGYVTLGLEQRDGYACLLVSDTGEGIVEEDLTRIFDRFYRADRSRSRHSGGAGLGLSIVKWVAEAHAGHATVASVPGRGSTFAIWLPLAGRPAPAEPPPGADEAAQPLAAR